MWLLKEMKNTKWRRVVYSSAVSVANRVLIIIFVITRPTHIHMNKDTNQHLLFLHVDAASQVHCTHYKLGVFVTLPTPPPPKCQKFYTNIWTTLLAKFGIQQDASFVKKWGSKRQIPTIHTKHPDPPTTFCSTKPAEKDDADKEAIRCKCTVM